MSASSQAPDRNDAVPVLDSRRKRNILIAMCTGLMAVQASVSGLNVAQANLGVDLAVSQGTILWIINGYTLALASLLLPVGAIGDRWGRRPVLISGLVVFFVASVAAGLAPSGNFLLAVRVLAGVGAAMIMPVTLSVITSTFPPEERGKAIGIWAGVAGSGGLVGLVVAAFMVDVLTWRWLFALPAMLVAFALVLSWKVVPNSREQSDKRFDTVGSITSFLAIGGLVLGIHEGPDRGWTDPITIIGLVVGVVAFAAFVIWELHCSDPLLDVRAFADRALAVGTFTLLLVFGVMFGIFLVLFPYFQGVLGWSALHAAVAILPLAVVMMPMSTLAPRVSARFGIRLTILAGLTLVGTGLTTLALQASVDGGYWSVLPGLLILGLGMGLSMTPSTVAITSSLPADKQGVASALNDTSRELGGALGVALLGSIVNAGYRSSIASTTAQLPPPVANTVERGLGAALAVGNQLGADGQTIITAAQHAFVDGWVHGMWIGVGLIAVGWLFVAILVDLEPNPPPKPTRT